VCVPVLVLIDDIYGIYVQDEFLDVLYWLRQVLCLVLGLVWGVIPLHGYVGMTLFLAVSAGVVYSYFALYQRVEEEEYGGAWELLKEGFMTSFAVFLVNWIITYTALHHS
jgi:hypothetical protein